MRRLLLVAALAAANLSLDARAEAFIGAAGGVSEWPDAACNPAGSCDRRNGTWLVRGGYMLLPYIGIEARYADLGKGSSSFAFAASGSTTSTDTSFESKGAGIGAVAALPLSDAFAFVAVVGAARLKTTFDTPDTTTAAVDGTVTVAGSHSEETHTNAYYGLGVDYRVARNTSVGVEATRYRVQSGSTENVDTFTASLTFHFR